MYILESVDSYESPEITDALAVSESLNALVRKASQYIPLGHIELQYDSYWKVKDYSDKKGCYVCRKREVEAFSPRLIWTDNRSKWEFLVIREIELV